MELASAQPVTNMAELTFAELTSRRVPLSAFEAAALTVAVAEALDATRCAGGTPVLPGDDQIVLSSTGHVSVTAVERSTPLDETIGLASLLQRLLGLDPLDRRGRVPDGLLILMARTLHQVDLPMLTPAAFRTSLARFATSEPAMLAAVFWRAARMRPVRNDSRRSDRRLSPGAVAPEMRRWIRAALSAQRFLMRSRTVAAGVAASAATFALIVMLGMGHATLDSNTSGGSDSSTAPLTHVEAIVPIGVPAAYTRVEQPPAPATESNAGLKTSSVRRPARATVRTSAHSPRNASGAAQVRPKVRSVRMVGLPRAPWVVSD